MPEPTDTSPPQTERKLRERNDALTTTLREARDQMIAMKEYVDDSEKRKAVAESLDYAIIAIDLRIDLLKRSILSARVGTEADEARRIAGASLADIFEAALRGHGYRIIASLVTVQS